jgi:tRNA (cytosine38-C5)-methyltransferase
MGKLTALDFYSGIGGFHAALNTVTDAQIVSAFDMNEHANSVYELNFGQRPCTTNILFLKKETVPHVDLWMLSPPCQPYSRKGLRLARDARSDSFLHLIELLVLLDEKPRYLIVENVLGFESSRVYELLMNALAECHYQVETHIVNPINHGYPYSRPRLFVLARMEPFLGNLAELMPKRDPRPLRDFIQDINPLEFLVSVDDLWKAGKHFDIVLPTDTRSCCITKAYGQYAKGGGSVLQTGSGERQTALEAYNELYKQKTEGQWYQCLENPLEELKLRYWTPREIANLHGFPSDYVMPDLTNKAWYRLLGNSLHVKLVADLLAYLLEARDSSHLQCR